MTLQVWSPQLNFVEHRDTLKTKGRARGSSFELLLGCPSVCTACIEGFFEAEKGVEML
jgi:hypothetical protein